MQKEGEEQAYELQKGSCLVHSKYKVLGKIGSTQHSTVHSISMIKGKKQIIRAVKVEASSVKEPQITNQVSVLKFVKDSNPDQIGFAKIYEYGYESQYHYLIMSLLGPNLQQLLKLCGGTFTLKTTIIIALQILDRLQVLHNHGYLYGDIKPDNFLVGLGQESPFIFIVDFGRCRRYRSKATGQHIIYKQNVHHAYDPIFASVNAHNHIQLSRRDDIQSLLYLAVYFKVGKLPWTKASDNKRKNEVNIEELKKRVTPEMLCHRMPLEIIDLMYYTRSIEFYEKPDYDFIRKLFYRCLERQVIDANLIYDWNRLEQVDFKVYTGEPRIVLSINKGDDNNDSLHSDSDDKEEAEDEEQQQSGLLAK